MTNLERPITTTAGIGLRKPHYKQLIEGTHDVGFLEVHSENYFGFGAELELLKQARLKYPISLHGVGLSLGSAEPISEKHLKSLKKLVDTIDPIFVSDHASWSMSGNAHLNDLFPIPYNAESLSHLCDNIKKTQDFLGRNILIENPSTYLQFENEMTEEEFLNAAVKTTDCKLLLDINNIFVNSKNHNFDPFAYIKNINDEAVAQIHLAGHTVVEVEGKEIRIDTHDSMVIRDVWNLYYFTIQLIGRVPTLIEWDDKFPELDFLLSEAKKASQILRLQGEKDAA